MTSALGVRIMPLYLHLAALLGDRPRRAPYSTTASAHSSTKHNSTWPSYARRSTS